MESKDSLNIVQPQNGTIQKQQNDDIVSQFRECLKHIYESCSQLQSDKEFTVYGYSLMLHVDSGIVPKLTADPEYLRVLRNWVRDDIAVYEKQFTNHLHKLCSSRSKVFSPFLSLGAAATCGFSSLKKKELLANVLLPKQTLEDYKSRITRVVAFLHHVASTAGLRLTTVCVTCNALVSLRYHSLWIEKELEKDYMFPPQPSLNLATH